MEGSIDYGGIQPHYVIDASHPALKALLMEARSLGAEPLPVVGKIDRVVRLVRRVLTARSYVGSRYVAVLRAARAAHRNVSLGEYVEAHAGVCREFAMITHLLLKEAGVGNHYAYAAAKQGDDVEDHAVCLTEIDGETWVVDSYNDNFHGGRLADFLKRGGSRLGDVRIPGAKPSVRGCSLAIAPYPVFWNPSEATRP